jgi:hypothetical protein
MTLGSLLKTRVPPKIEVTDLSLEEDLNSLPIPIADDLSHGPKTRLSIPNIIVSTILSFQMHHYWPSIGLKGSFSSERP